MLLTKYKHHHETVLIVLTTFVPMSLDLGLFVSYLCDLFFIFIFIFIYDYSNSIIPGIQTHLLFCLFFFRINNIIIKEDEECE